MVEKVYAVSDITYPKDKKNGPAVTMYKVGDVIDDPELAALFSSNAKELVGTKKDADMAIRAKELRKKKGYSRDA